MAKMLAVILLALAFVLSVAARPQLHRRGLPGAVYTCTSPDFRGDCQWTAPSNRCMQPGPWPNSVMSIGPDPDGTCTLYEKFDCTGREIRTLSFPGIAGGVPEFAGFRCQPNTSARSQSNRVEFSSATSKALDPFADPRLAGGMGSLERKKNLAAIIEMENNGFKDGLIGLKKGVYY